MPKKKPRRARAPKPPHIEPDELRRLAKLARSFMPKASAEREASDRDAIRELVFLVGAGAGRAFGTWSEISIRTIGLALADVTGAEEEWRAIRIWRAVEALGGEDRKKVRREVARLLREREDEAAGGTKRSKRRS